MQDITIFYGEQIFHGVSFHFVRLSVLVTGVDQTSRSRFLLVISPFCSNFCCLYFCTLSIICCMTLIYSFIFSVTNIVDPKSLLLFAVSPSLFQSITVSYDGNSDHSVLVDSAIKVCSLKEEQRGTRAASRPAAWIRSGFFS